MSHTRSAIPLRGARRLPVFALALCLLGPLSGCLSDIDYRIHQVLPVRADLVADGKVKAETISGPSLNLSRPSAQQVNQEFLVSGTVSRRPGYNDDIPGFLALQVINPSGILTDQLTIHWVPEVIPSTGDCTATYNARFLGIPREGSTIRIVYFESEAMLKASGAEVGRSIYAMSTRPRSVRQDTRTPARASVDAVKLNDVQVRLVCAKITRVKSESADGKQVFESVLPQLAIELEIKNVSVSGSDIVQYQTWGDSTPQGADGRTTLSDDGGQSYQLAKYGFGDRPIGRVDSASIHPSKSIDDILVFREIPSDGATSLTLDLPARNVGQAGILHLQFPASVIQR